MSTLLKKQKIKSDKSFNLKHYLLYLYLAFFCLMVIAIKNQKHQVRDYKISPLSDLTSYEKKQLIDYLSNKKPQSSKEIAKYLNSHFEYKRILVSFYQNQFYLKLMKHIPLFKIFENKFISEEGEIFFEKNQSFNRNTFTIKNKAKFDSKDLIHLYDLLPKDLNLQHFIYDSYLGYTVKKDDSFEILVGHPPFESKILKLSKVMDNYKDKSLISINLSLDKKVILKSGGISL